MNVELGFGDLRWKLGKFFELILFRLKVRVQFINSFESWLWK